MRVLLVSWLVFVGAVRAAPLERVAELRVFSSGGAGAPGEATRSYRRQGSALVGEGRTLPATVADDLVRLLLASENERAVEVVSELGVTPEALAAHRDDVISLANGDRPTAPAEVREWARERLTHEYVAERVHGDYCRARMVSPSDQAPPIEVAFRLEGTPAELVVASTRQRHGLFPWNVSFEGRSWSTLSPKVSGAVSRLLEPGAPGADFDDGSRYWGRGFWHDREAWSRLLGMDLERRLAFHLASHLPGVEPHASRFQLSGAFLAGLPGNWLLSVHVNVRPPAATSGSWLGLGERGLPRERVTWYVRIGSDGVAKQGWDVLAAGWARLDQALTSRPWLREWRAAAPDRSLHLYVGEGAFMQVPQGDTFEPQVVAPWRHAGLTGQPDTLVGLVQGDSFCGAVWLSEGEPRSIVNHVQSRRGPHWLDALDLPPGRGDGRYVLVQPDGAHELRSMAPQQRAPFVPYLQFPPRPGGR